MTQSCKRCHGDGDVPRPDKTWWAFWRMNTCALCGGDGLDKLIDEPEPYVAPRGDDSPLWFALPAGIILGPVILWYLCG